jgi:hypothetical protein
MITISLMAAQVNTLDISAARAVVEQWLQSGKKGDLQLRFEVQLPREENDPREWSEIPEVRLWFVRLDAAYPWLPYALDWESGELTRYAAMLVPHQFSQMDGIQFNPEALEIFVMAKVFAVMEWMQREGVSNRTKVKFMTQVLGYELEDGFFDLIGF